jgi:hypothetical protein
MSDLKDEKIKGLQEQVSRLQNENRFLKLQISMHDESVVADMRSGKVMEAPHKSHALLNLSKRATVLRKGVPLYAKR